jgi:hypothetical protein
MGKATAIVVSIVTGVALELGVQAVSGRREAWDSGEYWTIGLPVVAAISFVTGFLSRGTAWRWAILVIPSQVMTMMARSGEMGGLFPLAVILAMILGLPFLLVAFVGSRFRSTT